MIIQRKLLYVLDIIYAESKKELLKELLDIDNKPNMKLSLTTIIPSVDINSFYLPSETKNSHFPFSSNIIDMKKGMPRPLL